MEIPVSSARFILIAVFLVVNTGYLEGSPTDSSGMLAALHTGWRNGSPKGLLNDMPAGCEGHICRIMPPEYPSETIQLLLNETFPFILTMPSEPPTDRLGNDEFKNDCEIITSSGPVYYIRDKFKRVRVVAQHKDTFKQIYRSEKCANPGRLLLDQDTENFSKTDMHKKNLSCEEVIQDFMFMVLTPDGNGLEYVKAKNGMPVACNCKYNSKAK